MGMKDITFSSSSLVIIRQNSTIKKLPKLIYDIRTNDIETIMDWFNRYKLQAEQTDAPDKDNLRGLS
jgi:hypothetical protein